MLYVSSSFSQILNMKKAATHKKKSIFNISKRNTYLLKCVFRFRLSRTFGCSLPSCSSIFVNFFPFFFFSPFSAFSLSCLLWRRLLKNMLTDRSKTVPDVSAWLIWSMFFRFFSPFSFSFVVFQALLLLLLLSL